MNENSTCDPTDRLMSTLRVRLPGATDAALDLELINVLDRFFRRTNAWRHEDDIKLIENVTDYSITPPENSVMVRVMQIFHGQQPVSPYYADTSSGTGFSSRQRIVADQMWSMDDPTLPAAAKFDPDQVIEQSNVIRYAIFYPEYIAVNLPSEEAVEKPVHVIMSLSINPSVCENGCGGLDLPEWMWHMYHDAWAHGVQAEMMSQISKPYTNPVMAEYHGRIFRNKMAFHKQEADRGFIHDRPTWRFPRGGWITRR
jgi:hypothetical protein